MPHCPKGKDQLNFNSFIIVRGPLSLSLTAVLNCYMRNCLEEAEALDMTSLGIFGCYTEYLLLFIDGFLAPDPLVKD